MELLKETEKLPYKIASTLIDFDNKLGEVEEDVVVDRETY